MGMRRFFYRLLGLDTEPVRTLSTDPLALATDDAMRLLDAMLHGAPWGRRAWSKAMGETRWERATDLLRAMDIVDRKGRCLLPMGFSQFDAEAMVREAAYRARARAQHRNWVAPRR